MELIESRTGLSYPYQRLICGGRELEPDKSLDELGVRTKETLYLLERSHRLCPSWAATGTCKDFCCPFRDSHTAANSPRYVEYMINRGEEVCVPCTAPKATAIPRKFALEIKTPGQDDAATSEIPQISPVPPVVSEMLNYDWEPEATFAQRTVSTESKQAWPILAPTPGGISWDSFTKSEASSVTTPKDKILLDFNSSAEALLMNSDIPMNTKILQQQASSWEGTEEVRAAAYTAWVAGRAKKLRQPLASDAIPHPLTIQATTA